MTAGGKGALACINDRWPHDKPNTGRGHLLALCDKERWEKSAAVPI
jgi:hypothetical protein